MSRPTDIYEQGPGNVSNSCRRLQHRHPNRQHCLHSDADDGHAQHKPPSKLYCIAVQCDSMVDKPQAN